MGVTLVEFDIIEKIRNIYPEGKMTHFSEVELGFEGGG